MASNYLHMTRSLNYCKYFATSRPHQESTTSRKIIKVNMQEIMDFKFKKGDDDKFGYGRMYTRKSQNGEVDIAIAMYNLDFKLSPKIVQYEKTTTFLGFVTGSTKMWKRESASLSLRQDAVLQAYFLRKSTE